MIAIRWLTTILVILAPAGLLPAQGESDAVTEEEPSELVTEPSVEQLPVFDDAPSLDALSMDGFEDPLQESAASEEPEAGEGAPERIAFRANGLLYSSLSWLPDMTLPLPKAAGQGIVSAGLLWSPADWLDLHVDGTAAFATQGSQSALEPGFSAVLNQIGVRFSLADGMINIGLGAERRIEAPGMFLSPSDFVYSDDSLPGELAQRLGVWMVRASLILPLLTLDVIFLPVGQTDLFNLPVYDSDWTPDMLGGVVRAIMPLPIADIGLTAGWSDRTFQTGAFASGYVAPGLELHGEIGYRVRDQHFVETLLGALDPTLPVAAVLQSIAPSFNERLHVFRALIGARLEIGQTGMLMLEAYYNGNGMSDTEWDAWQPAAGSFFVTGSAAPSSSASALAQGLFPRRFYLLAGGALSNLADLFNIWLTTILGLEDASVAAILSAYWMAGVNQSFGLTGGMLIGPERDSGTWKSQYAALPMHWLVSADFQFSF